MCPQEVLPHLYYIQYTGFLGAFIAGFLINGACKRQSSLLLVWIIFANIKGFFDIIFLMVFEVSWSDISFGFQLELILNGVNIFFQSLGIFYANKARKEIDETGGYSQIA